MAIFTAHIADDYDMSMLSFDFIFDDPMTMETASNRFAYVIDQAPPVPDYYTVELLGSGFTYDAQGNPNGGTITTLRTIDNGNPEITISGLSLSAVYFSNVVNSSSPDDDKAMFAQIFSGNDQITTLGGTDLLRGYAGNDTLNGGAGADRMEGGLGNDAYWVDNAGDTVIELSGQGTDTVNSTIAFTLGSTLENLVLRGANAITGTGNALANVMSGNSSANRLIGLAGNDTLNGGAGADRMEGGLGNDAYYVDSASDVIVELAGQGTDIVYSMATRALTATLENLTLTGSVAIGGTGNNFANIITGNTGANSLSGLGGIDRLSGGLGNDKLNGGLGVDVLIGGAGNDAFVFNTKGAGAANRDTITDFANASANNDIIHLENAVFTKLAAGALNAANLKLGAAAADANDYVIYNKATGIVSYDADGNGAGAAVQIALLSNKATLTVADFFVI